MGTMSSGNNFLCVYSSKSHCDHKHVHVHSPTCGFTSARALNIWCTFIFLQTRIVHGKILWNGLYKHVQCKVPYQLQLTDILKSSLCFNIVVVYMYKLLKNYCYEEFKQFLELLGRSMCKCINKLTTERSDVPLILHVTCT